MSAEFVMVAVVLAAMFVVFPVLLQRAYDREDREADERFERRRG